jgi:hypothetical protein
MGFSFELPKALLTMKRIGSFQRRDVELARHRAETVAHGLRHRVPWARRSSNLVRVCAKMQANNPQKFESATKFLKARGGKRALKIGGFCSAKSAA